MAQFAMFQVKLFLLVDKFNFFNRIDYSKQIIRITQIYLAQVQYITIPQEFINNGVRPWRSIFSIFIHSDKLQNVYSVTPKLIRNNALSTRAVGLANTIKLQYQFSEGIKQLASYWCM
mmetsp:Transcript_9413/g.17613  ORF Transcript_9413/g.17613 Transcript_9413/m.17613 type:complete len:118 (-) Transcript_9413:10-363(-)